MKNKRGKALIWILVILFLVIIASIGIYFYLNNPKRIIKNAYYEEYAYEGCELNFQNTDFSSKEECYAAMKCISEIYAEST